jgi:2,3-bisphosphoglycerate-independent phosphoglycerate mutase
MSNRHPVVLIVLDGWGYRENTQDNAIAAAKTPQWDHWWQTRPHLLLDASGSAVGLPEGQMGNSEVGHMHIGAGRVVLQDFTYINQAIQTGDFFQNKTLITMIQDMRQSDHAIHVMGLLSPGGVHSHQDHLFAFLELCAQQQFTNVHLHLFLDGRDTPPKQVKANLATLTAQLARFPVAHIRSITGRYWAMDRDKRWERVEPVYTLLTSGQSPHHFATVDAAIDAYYAEGLSDEFFPATQIGQATPITSGDSIFYFNFRADRAKQLTQAFLNTQFDGFPRQTRPNLASFVTMTRYDTDLATKPVFPPRDLHHTLGEIISTQGLHQLRIAETEKFAHVTFFFNGGSTNQYSGEDRLLIPSPKIKTYDLQPQMSAPELTTELIKAIQSQAYDVIICNFANADMVGHTGDFNATVLAIEALDRALHRIGEAIQTVKGHLLITADHGNAECMFDEGTQQAHTAHTCEPVPLLYIGDSERQFRQEPGCLSDIAPTLLALLHITPPTAMTGHILWAQAHA